MIEFTQNEIDKLNDVSMDRNRSVRLGDILLTMLPKVAKFGTPSNGAKASGQLAITGTVAAGETFTIGNDIYEFCADLDFVEHPGHIIVDLGLAPELWFAEGALVLPVQPSIGETFSIGETVYTIVATLTNPGDVQLGGTLGATQTNIVNALLGMDGVNSPDPLAKASSTWGDYNQDELVMYARIGGVVGGTFLCSDTFAEPTNRFPDPYFQYGADSGPAFAVTKLVSVIGTSGTEPVSATHIGDNVVEIVADQGGVSGNSIGLSDTMTNGNVSESGESTTLTGGAPGDGIEDGSVWVDESFIYIHNGTGWCRVALGSAY